MAIAVVRNWSDLIRSSEGTRLYTIGTIVTVDLKVRDPMVVVTPEWLQPFQKGLYPVSAYIKELGSNQWVLN